MCGNGTKLVEQSELSDVVRYVYSSLNAICYAKAWYNG